MSWKTGNLHSPILDLAAKMCGKTNAIREIQTKVGEIAGLESLLRGPVCIHHFLLEVLDLSCCPCKLGLHLCKLLLGPG